MKTIYFVRHGSTEGNEGNVYQHPETPLSEKGVEQAKILATRFETIPLELLVTSDMKRALMTAEEISKHNKVPLEKNPLFREILRPSAVHGKSGEDAEAKRIMDEIKSNIDDPTYHHSDEENFFDLKERGVKALEFLESHPSEHIAVVTHGHILRLMLGLIIFGKELTGSTFRNLIKSFYVANTGITVCKPYEGRLSIRTWNDYAHLGEI